MSNYSWHHAMNVPGCDVTAEHIRRIVFKGQSDDLASLLKQQAYFIL